MKIKHILLILVFASLVSIGISYWRVYIMQDYLVHGFVPCDPESESCYIGDTESQYEFYKEIVKPAYAIPACDAWADTCPLLSCSPGEEQCEEILCDADAGDECSLPGE